MAVSFRGTMISIFRCRVRIMTHLSGYLRTGMKGNIAIPYIQVVHTGTVTEKKGRREKYAQSVWVDVFPVDGAGYTKEDLAENYAEYWKNIEETRKIFGRYKPYPNPMKQSDRWKKCEDIGGIWYGCLFWR